MYEGCLKNELMSVNKLKLSLSIVTEISFDFRKYQKLTISSLYKMVGQMFTIPKYFIFRNDINHWTFSIRNLQRFVIKYTTLKTHILRYL